MAFVYFDIAVRAVQFQATSAVLQVSDAYGLSLGHVSGNHCPIETYRVLLGSLDTLEQGSDQLVQQTNTLTKEESKTILMLPQLIDKKLGVDGDREEILAVKIEAD